MSKAESYARLRENAKKLVMQAYVEGLTVGEAVEATNLRRDFINAIYNSLVKEAVEEAHKLKRQMLSKSLGEHMKGPGNVVA